MAKTHKFSELVNPNLFKPTFHKPIEILDRPVEVADFEFATGNFGTYVIFSCVGLVDKETGEVFKFSSGASSIVKAFEYMEENGIDLPIEVTFRQQGRAWFIE
jgi:hypothetical protein